MAKKTQKRNLRKTNNKSLRRSNKKSLKKTKGGSGWEFAVGDERLDKFINGQSEETIPKLIDYWKKKYIENKHKGPSSLSDEGMEVMEEIENKRRGELHQKKRCG